MFEAAVPSAAFIAIDLEMTGITLNSNPFTKISASDTPDVRYGKMQKVASQYGIAQWGVCLFAEGQDSSGSGKRTYEVRPFNFYCFPRAHNDSFSQQLLIDSSSMDFLRSHSFDFGRWMSKGISYLDAAGERNLAESLFPTPQQLDPLDMPGRPQHKIELTRQDDISYLANVMESVGAMLQSGAKELVLPNCNTFLARAVRETIEARFPHLIVETRPGKSRWIPQRVVLNLTVEEKQEREERDKAAKRKVFREQVGLRRVWKMICKSRKPVVVHNGLYDLLFLYHRMEAPLPDGAAAFKKAKAALLPTTYDTKRMQKHRGKTDTEAGGSCRLLLQCWPLIIPTSNSIPQVWRTLLSSWQRGLPCRWSSSWLRASTPTEQMRATPSSTKQATMHTSPVGFLRTSWPIPASRTCLCTPTIYTSCGRCGTSTPMWRATWWARIDSSSTLTRASSSGSTASSTPSTTRTSSGTSLTSPARRGML